MATAARPGRAILPPKRGEVRHPKTAQVPPPTAASSTTIATTTIATTGKHPLIFIDVDGVLNASGQPDDHDLYWPAGHEASMRDNYLVLSAERLKRFAALVVEYDCHIVLSTSWRLDTLPRTVLLSAFAELGIDSHVVGDTADLSQTSEGVYPAGVRVDEICEWLDRHGSSGASWVAIDDAPMGTEVAQEHRPRAEGAPMVMEGHFVCTDSDEGLTEAVCHQAVQLLMAQARARAVT